MKNYQPVEGAKSVAFHPCEKFVRMFRWQVAALGLAAGIASSAFAVRPTTVYLVQHSHSDIGYARPQTEMIADYVRQIDCALDFCEATADYPEDAKFRWTCEILGAVDHYLRYRSPADVARFKKWVLKGQIEVTALSLNTSEFTAPATLRAGMRPLATCRALGLPVRLAMQNDVNGFPWILADDFADLGVRYIWTGENSGRAYIPFSRPTVFRWQSPSGREVLYFRGEHYMAANNFGTHTGDLDGFTQKLTNYLDRLDKSGYPYTSIGVAYGGYQTDDSAPCAGSSDLVRRWNAERAAMTGVRVVCATPSMFLDAVSKEVTPANTPTYRSAFPDWWSDGFGTAALETAEARRAASILAGAQALAAQNVLAGGTTPPGLVSLFDATHKNLDYWGEHTFGANTAIRDPHCWKSLEGHRTKYAFAWNALREAMLARESATALLRGSLARERDYDLITLFNPNPWTRSGTADVFIERAVIPTGSNFRIVDAAGQAIPAIRLEDETAARSNGADGVYFRLYGTDIPPCGYKTYRIEIGGAPSGKHVPTKLENAFYKLTLDVARGAVKHLVDKRTGRDLVDASAPQAFGEVLYEEMTRERRCISQLKNYKPGACKRQACSNFKLAGGTSNALYDSIRLAGDFPEEGSSQFTVEIRLLKTSPDVEFHYSLRRTQSERTSSVYVAFPFAGQKLRCDVPGGVMKPGENQLPGSSTAWNVAQNFIAVTDGANETWMACRGTPLVQFGKMFSDYPFDYVKKYEKAHVYAWPMNNYWWTNFSKMQNGEFSWSYRLTARTQAGNDAAALRWAMGDREPLVALVTTRGPQRTAPRERTGLNVADMGLVITDLMPARDGNGVILAVGSRVDSPRPLKLTDGFGRVLSFELVDATERVIGPAQTECVVQPRANLLVRVKSASGCVDVKAPAAPALPQAKAYRFYRFCVNEIKGEDNGTQVAELRLFAGEREMTGRHVRVLADTNTMTAAGKCWPERQPPEKVFDGVLLEKWFDWRGATGEPRKIRDATWVGVEFAEPVALTKYSWYTCEDHPLRDPASWKFQGSQDGRTWIDLDTVTGFNAPSARNVKAITRAIAR